MARNEAQALAGFYPTPPHLIPAIAALLDTAEHTNYTVADPCAGEGEAVLGIVNAAFGTSLGLLTLYTCELEKTRHATLKVNIQASKVHWRSHESALRGDAFQVVWNKPGIDFLYLNPPYDLDHVHGRLEQRFLDRFQGALTDGGVLAFVVPHYALRASARALAMGFTDLACFRFPDPDFGAYKQVVLFAVKTTDQLSPDPAIIAQVEAWAESVEDMPILGEPTEIVFTPPQSNVYTTDWGMRAFDRIGLLKKVRPWTQSNRLGSYVPVPHIIPELPVEELMFRTYKLATPPRPAHIAAGIASGLFNGRRVSSETEGLPDLLVKGVFDREFVTVEEKKNKDGDVTSVVQVQQPKLITTILDLSTKKYTTLGSGGESKVLDVEKMTIEDLLKHYGPSLMGVMQQQCPVMYDPKRDADSVTLAPTARKLFKAQEHSAKALVMLLGGNKAKDRKYRSAQLLGEIGSGKSCLALTVARTIAKRMLVLCPPHLLTSWTNETSATFPDAEVRVLKDIGDIEALADIPAERFLVAILSRETAKLGHGWEAVTKSCPKCGGELPKEDAVKKRLRCENRDISIKDDLGLAAYSFGLQLLEHLPESHRLRGILRTVHLNRILDKNALVPKDERPEWVFQPANVEHMTDLVFAKMMLNSTNEGELPKLFAKLLMAAYDPARIARYVRILSQHQEYYIKDMAKNLVYLLEEGTELQKELTGLFETSNWQSWDMYYKAARSYGHNTHLGMLKWTDGVLTLDAKEANSLDLAEAILTGLIACGKIYLTPECGEALFQAVPEPRRVALAKHIAKYSPNLFDFICLDESHEAANADSAQSQAYHSLTGLGIPTLFMTGSVMNGYAKSLYTNMWALSPDFRHEFAREDAQRFIDRYGYRKRIISDKDKESGEVVAFGAMSDRVQRSERTAGDAPGILPLFLFRHLLPVSVTLHKADLAIDIPPCTVTKHVVEADSELLGSYKSLLASLRDQIKKDRFDPDLSGKLFGQLSELPSYLDRSTADTGNNDDGTYEIRYPESVGAGIVATGKQFSASEVSAKEQWMLDTLKAELAEGRNAMVFAWHTTLLPRIARLIEERLGVKAPILYADRVPTSKRQTWIEQHVVKKNSRVLIVNPASVSTGLNSLVHFSTELWMENPMCSPIMFRQAVGRVDRIGQKKDTRIHFAVFKDTLQEQMYELLMRKVEISISTDGLDNESMLASAGVGSQHLSGMSIGRQLWALINDDD